MSLTNIKSNLRSERGFTIVELLIVVVVIAILAAITIVSYNGITSRANASAAKTALGTVQKKIELYQTENGRYPINLGEMTASESNSWYIPASAVTDASANPQASASPADLNGKNRVAVVSCGNATPTAANVTGVRITWFDFDNNTTATVNLGTCSVVGTNGATAWDGTDAS